MGSRDPEAIYRVALPMTFATFPIRETAGKASLVQQSLNSVKPNEAWYGLLRMGDFLRWGIAADCSVLRWAGHGGRSITMSSTEHPISKLKMVTDENGRQRDVPGQIDGHSAEEQKESKDSPLPASQRK